MGRLNLADWIDCTEVEGPGRRSALWVQGCVIRCPGCCNAHMFDIVPNRLVDSGEVIDWIKNARQQHGIEGVTFLGGEPMLQARGLAAVAAGCWNQGLSVLVFTGYRLEYLKGNPMPGIMDLLATTDLLVDGPYIRDDPERQRNWAGSANQQFHFLTNRYPPGIEFAPAYSHGFEVRISKDGILRSNGWPSEIGREITNG